MNPTRNQSSIINHQSSILGLGIDHCEVERIRNAFARWGGRFRDRVFTAGEVAYCEARRATSAAHYAARFAAKEASLKALGSGLAMGINWREVEVTRAPGEPPRLKLTGRALARAERMGIATLLVSITHTDTLASAVVTAGP